MAIAMRKAGCCLVVVVVVAMAVVMGAGAAGRCDAGQLTVCAGAIAIGSRPTAACCSGLRAQQGCFCQFAKDPRYGRYINSPNARRAVSSCGLPLPSCH
uniref:Bifunctional inhibitor/plant lipid transfer protein/seed storage helical domain-containing protein n=1 Tax=Leersia perrieri TaxID=77586 RepID=A0A0D9VNJ2_9ORYZ